MKDGEYEQLNPNDSYTIAGPQYILNETGNGYTMFKDSEIIFKEGSTDANVFIEYLTINLKGTIPEEYKESQGRINIY